jgi:hypothetical protein
MSQIATISEFLLQAGTEYRVFDIGRTIHSISTQQFLEIENALSKPQFPRAQHAWFAIIFWNKTLSDQHYIWFVKLPIDEQGFIVAAARNHYLQIIVDALGQQLEQAPSKNAQLPDNPYSFIPNQHQLADFTSISRAHLKLGQSDFYQVATSYLKNPQSADWQTVPVQGIADLATQINQPEIEYLLVKHFTALAEPVKFALLTSIENQPLKTKTVELIKHFLLNNPNNPIIWQQGLRALSQSVNKELVEELLNHAVSSELATDQNLLSVISGRLWHYLNSPQMLRSFLNAVANCDSSSVLFVAIYRDLVQIPSLRLSMLEMLRWPDKSPELTRSVGKLFGGH